MLTRRIIALGIVSSLLFAAMPVLAEDMPTETAAPAPVDLVCMQTAVETRDTAIISSFGTFNASVSAALTARKTELKAAWGMADREARRAAIKAAWMKYKDGFKSAKKAFKEAKRAAWGAFAEDRRECNGTGDGDAGRGVDAQL